MNQVGEQLSAASAEDRPLRMPEEGREHASRIHEGGEFGRFRQVFPPELLDRVTDAADREVGYLRGPCNGARSPWR
jgi:hypothetical protein